LTDTAPGQPNLGIPGIDSVQEIGRKASHTTYRVRDVATGRVVIVKLLNAGRDWPGLADRFEREQSALAQLVGHPNIVPVYGHGWTETGMPYIVSGEETGGSIGDRLRGPTPMTGPDVLALGVRLAGALESAHRAGVVHGDLRPDDMMLTPQGEPLLADFGLVTLVRPNAAGVTDPQELAHVAPELLDGQPASPSSDIYALGSALYTLLAGEPAYVRRTDTSVIPVIKRIASDPLPDLKDKNVPPSVADAVGKAMAKDPAERYRTAQDFGRALQQAQVAMHLPMTDMTLLGEASAATRATQTTQTTPVAAAAAGGAAAGAMAGAAAAGPGGMPPPGGPPGGPGGPPGGAPPAKSRTPLIVGGVILAAIVIAAIVFFATRGSDSKNASSSSDTTTTTVRRTTTSTTSTTTTSTPASSDDVVLVNDGGQLTVTVPSTWSDTSTVTSSSTGLPDLQASTNLTEFFAGTYKEPGIQLVAFKPTDLDPNNLDGDLDLFLNGDRPGGTMATVCTRGTRQDAVTTAGGFTTRLEILTACNGGGDIMLVAATNATHDFVMGAEVHFGSPPDDPGTQLALKTMNVVKFP